MWKASSATGKYAHAVTAIALATACSGNSGDLIDTPEGNPTRIMLLGDWSATFVETDDTCGIDLEEALFTAEAGVRFFPPDAGINRLYISTPWHSCYIFANAEVNEPADVLSGSDRGLIWRFIEGDCQIRDEATIEFRTNSHDWNRFAGVERHHYSYLSGDCRGFDNCDWGVAVQGARGSTNSISCTTGPRGPRPALGTPAF